jgi:hypothetical protein
MRDKLTQGHQAEGDIQEAWDIERAGEGSEEKGEAQMDDLIFWFPY